MSAWQRLRNLFRPRPVEDDVREELESLRAIAEPGELGNLTLAAEDARAEWSWPVLERIGRDLSMAYRTLRNSPGYSLTCIAILALGIGANTAIFSALHSVVLKALPYPAADRLVFMWGKVPSLPWPIGPRMPAQRIQYQEWQKQSDLFDHVAAFHIAPLNETGVAKPRTLETAFVSANLLPLLGARPAAGRLFRADEEQKGADRVVLLSDRYFDQRFQRDPSVIGKSITLGREDYTVIGVLPARFELPPLMEGTDQKRPYVWIPLSRVWKTASDDTAFHLQVIAQRKANVSVDQIRVAVNALQTRLNKADGERYPLTQTSIFPLHEEAQSPYINLALYVLVGAVGLLLLIGCANLANLTMARSIKRAREISIRRALGATRARVILQLLTESLLLSLAGAAVGVLLAEGLIEWVLRPYAPILRPEEIELNWVVFAFAMAVTILTTALFGLMPALTVSKVGVNEALKSRGGGGATAALARGRNFLTTAEVGLAVVLLCTSGLLIRTFVNLIQTGLGFSTDNLIVAQIDPPETRYPDAASRSRFYSRLLARARGIPGVTTASLATTMPMLGYNFTTFGIAGQPKPQSIDKMPSADVAEVGSNYFRVMGLPILQGRDFNPDDFTLSRGKGAATVLVNRAFAEQFFKGRTVLGQRLLLDDDRPFEIVGVAENFLALGAIDRARPQFFRPRTEAGGMKLLLRTGIAPEPLIDEVRSVVLSVDPELPLTDLDSMNGVIRDAASDPRFLVVMMASFAALALLLAMIGVYSVLSNLVAAQTRELGIRMALGATAGAVGWMVVRESMKPLAIGLVLGLGASIAAGRVLESLSQGIVPGHPLTYALAALSVLLVAPAAVWGPVRRATSVECTVALREE